MYWTALHVSCAARTQCEWKSHVLISAVFECYLPFSLDIQRVCGASVWLALSLFWAQQRPVVVLHDASNLQLQLCSSAHHLTVERVSCKMKADSVTGRVIKTVYCCRVAVTAAEHLPDVEMWLCTIQITNNTPSTPVQWKSIWIICVCWIIRCLGTAQTVGREDIWFNRKLRFYWRMGD